MFKISLKAARELSGYSINEVASLCDLTEDCYREYEDDFGKVLARIAHVIHSLFKISLDTIYIGE
jgi:DNA-binding XRE family transcriptional regulator